jgi:diguanylate cyclase (GGDEF)-like protein
MELRKQIAVLARSATTLNFLDSFFRDRAHYVPAFLKETDAFLSHVTSNSLSAAISEASLLPSSSEKISELPLIVLIGGDIRKGVKKAISCKAAQYICRPYIEDDLEYKLGSMISDNEKIRTMESEIKELGAIVDLSRMTYNIRNPNELLFAIVTKIAEIIPVTRCSMIKVDRTRKSAFVIASFEDPAFSGVKISLRKYPEIARALSSKKPVVIRDVSTDPLMEKVREVVTPLGIQSILVLPILLQNRIIGTLFLRTSRAGHAFSEIEIRLLAALAGASANALHNAFLFEQVEDEKSRLEKLAITDYLTEIYNIRFFYHRIIEEFSRCQRYSLPISCLMVDIDHFKKINDHYGHRTGDMILKEFAKLLKKHSRKSDVLARYGGEEFIILLPQTSKEGAVAEGDRIRELIKSHRFKTMRNLSGLTVSVGIATHPHRNIKTHDDLIAFADAALFKAKNSGRDRLAVYGR